MNVDKYISIEAQQLMGDSYATYFVDMVNVNSSGASRANLRSVTNVHLARKIARDVAKMVPCRVCDETLSGDITVRQ
jgi:hypothetical protein